MSKPKNWKLSLIVLLLALNLAATGGLAAYELSSRDRLPTGSFSSQMQTNDSYTLYIGTNDKDTYTQLIPTDQAIAMVNAICARYVDGYTSSLATGGWVDEKGRLTQEHTLVYTFHGVKQEQIQSIMDEVLKKLNQNTILVEYGTTKSMYYGGRGK